MATLTESIHPLPSSGRLRPYNAGKDLSVVADLIELGFANTLDEDGRRYVSQMRSASASLFGFGGIAGRLAGAPGEGYVWEQDGRVVGNLTLIPYLVSARRYFLIANVVVHPDYRRQGIGWALTAKGVEHARQASAPAVWLHVREDNPGAISLYRQLGFEQRAVRTTWRAVGEGPRPLLPPGTAVRGQRSQDWDLQHAWLQRSYPAELTWQLPLRVSSLRPGLLGGFTRLFNDLHIIQWALTSQGRLQAVASWQSSGGAASILWLAADPQADPTALQGLLLHTRRNTPTRRPLIIDYPAHTLDPAFEAAGFHNQQTLIWMEVKF
jgi:ribosomal protein S18 acetylase RimI-like enzyme